MRFTFPDTAAFAAWRSAAVSNRKRISLACAALLLLIAAGYGAWVLCIPTRNFPRNQLITIPVNASSQQMALVLEQAHVIRSPFYFKVLTRLTRQDRGLESGLYIFPKRMGLAEVAWRISHGQHGIQAIRVTLTEGMTVHDMSDTLSSELPGFDARAFTRLASTSEGYLFPDTYFIYPGTAADTVYKELTARFTERIVTLQSEIASFKKPLREVVTMASILEREAKTPDDMRMVSGILWNRIRLGMPLQVDAVFGYVHGVNGYTPTQKDLESGTPYNTYLHTGLPPTPISNPGLEALRAAVTPAHTDYLYYLTGKDGKMHYAKTFEQHKLNRQKYL